MRTGFGNMMQYLNVPCAIFSLLAMNGLAEAPPKPVVSSQATVEVRMVMMSREAAYDLFKPEVTLGKVGLVNDETLRRIHEFVVKKNATVLCQPKITTVSGNTAQVKSVSQVRWPTKYSPVDISTGKSGKEQETAIYPQDFDTREVGTLLNVTPTIMPDGKTINVVLVPELAQQLSNTKYEVSPRGRGTVEQPKFRSRQITTTVQVLSGTTILLGVADPIENEDPNQIVLILLTAMVVR